MATEYPPANPIFSVVYKLASSVRNIKEFTRCMSRLGESLNSVIAQLNQKAPEEDESWELKKSTRKCREKYCQMQSSSAVFVNRFYQLVCFAELDDSTSSKIAASVERGDYTDFSAYTSQLKHYLVQCNELYKEFVTTCTDAESHSQSVVANLQPSKWKMTGFEVKTSQPSNSWPAMTILFGILGSVGTFIVLKLLEYSLFTSLGASAIMGLAVIGVLRKATVNFNKRSEISQAISHRLQYIEDSFQKVIQDYELLQNSGLNCNTSFQELQDSLTYISFDIAKVSFQSAFSSLQDEVKKARGSLQHCHEKLYKGIIITEINSF